MNDMTDILDLPAVEFKLNRKDILQKLWSQHSKHASAADHAIYFALLAALSKPDNQDAYIKAKLVAAFTPITNKVKLANGATPHQSLDQAVIEASRTLDHALYYKAYPNHVRAPQVDGRLMTDWTAHYIDQFKRRAKDDPFLLEAVNFCTAEELRAAIALLKEFAW